MLLRSNRGPIWKLLDCIHHLCYSLQTEITLQRKQNLLHNIDIRKEEIMLPDYLKTKEKLGKMLNSEMKKAKFRHMGPFADTPKSNLFAISSFGLRKNF